MYFDKDWALYIIISLRAKLYVGKLKKLESMEYICVRRILMTSHVQKWDFTTTRNHALISSVLKSLQGEWKCLQKFNFILIICKNKWRAEHRVRYCSDFCYNTPPKLPPILLILETCSKEFQGKYRRHNIDFHIHKIHYIWYFVMLIVDSE